MRRFSNGGWLVVSVGFVKPIRVRVGSVPRSSRKHGHFGSLKEDYEGGWVYKTFGRSGNYFFISKPQTFKSTHVKDLVVKISKEGRKICIFDYSSEWSGSVTRKNFNASSFGAYPMCLENYKILRDFTFEISEFKYPSDYVSLGFTEDAAKLMAKFVIGAAKFHKNKTEKFQEFITELPTKEDELGRFNEKYGKFGVSLTVQLNWMTKMSLVQNWDFISAWFKQKNDGRRVYDFKSEWLRCQNLIIDLSMEKVEGGRRIRVGEPRRARAWAGLVLRQLSEVHKLTRGVFVFEELSHLAPNVVADYDYLPSSLNEIRSLMTYYPKDGVVVFGLFQNEGQIFQELLGLSRAKVVGQAEGGGDMYGLAAQNYFDPERGVREVLWYESLHKWIRYVPDISCCWPYHT